MIDRKPHPSGRPIRKEFVKRLSFSRVPYNEPLTPGLRKPQPTNAIGFTAELFSSDSKPIDGKK